MTLSWFSIVRLGLVQMCMGAVVVLTTSTLNRLMVVELALPAALPGLLVALYYGIQVSRPQWGFLSDTGGNRTRWIIGGMTVLALGGLGAASSIPVLATHFWLGLVLSMLSYAMIGLGTGASGTSLLALLATSTAPERRAAAATITWLMMIAGIAVTAGVVGKMLDPYSHALLVRIVGVVSVSAITLTILAMTGIERGIPARPAPEPMPLLEGLGEIWGEPRARNFTIFVFLSMTAYFMQELILEPYAGLVFAYTPGQSTTLSGAQNGGVFAGMLTVGIAATGLGLGQLRSWVILGCLGSAISLVVIAIFGILGPGSPLMLAVVFLGVFNGIYAVATIGVMMALAGQGREAREGTRMGLWGAAQAIAAGIGGLVGAAAADILRKALPDEMAFSIVFTIEAGLFVVAAVLAAAIIERRNKSGVASIRGQ